MGFNSLVVVFIPEWWLLPTTTDQCSYNTDYHHNILSDSDKEEKAASKFISSL